MHVEGPWVRSEPGETHETFTRGTLDTRITIRLDMHPRQTDLFKGCLQVFQVMGAVWSMGVPNGHQPIRPPHEPQSGALAFAGAKEWLVPESPPGASRGLLLCRSGTFMVGKPRHLHKVAVQTLHFQSWKSSHLHWNRVQETHHSLPSGPRVEQGCSPQVSGMMRHAPVVNASFVCNRTLVSWVRTKHDVGVL